MVEITTRTSTTVTAFNNLHRHTNNCTSKIISNQHLINHIVGYGEVYSYFSMKYKYDIKQTSIETYREDEKKIKIIQSHIDT